MKAISSHRSSRSSAGKSSSQARDGKSPTHHALVVRSTGSEAAAALLDGMDQATHDAIDAAGRHQMIAESAYYRAERRGFDGGRDVDDWLEAEQEIDGYLRDHGHERIQPQE